MKSVRSVSSFLVAAFAVGVMPLAVGASDTPSEGQVAVPRDLDAVESEPPRHRVQLGGERGRDLGG